LLFGQQFYSSNFMFGSYAYPDALERLQEHELFWSTPVSEHHRQFLINNNINYLLVRRDMPFPAELVTTPWVRIVIENSDYYLLDVTNAH
jgi:hypothetical protein